jgi:ATP-dependent RNA helicase SUPV3L1/SUV3
LAHIALEAPRVRTIHIHCGETNSGKTWRSLRQLAKAQCGAYLAPLRLLAWEAYESLRELNCPAELLTGEEAIHLPGARVVAATIEMFPHRRYDLVVIDEAQMVGDTERGWAWLQALVTANADELHVCCAPHGLAYLKALFSALKDRVIVHQYERLTPLLPVPQHISLDRLPERSAVVAFSRLAVLRLKAQIERSHKAPCAAIYGALPPAVRRAQAMRVRSGESPFVVATDAIGMGVNFPVDHVFLFSCEKYDGSQERSLYPEEVRQIIGRAGRFGLSKVGYYGGLSKGVHANLLALACLEPRPITQAFLRPTASQLSGLSGPLAQRIRQWRKLAKPAHEHLVKVAPVQQLIELATLLPRKLEQKLDQAFVLITAPVDRTSLGYWRAIAESIANSRPIPSPKDAPHAIRHDMDLEHAEQALKERELCLWFLRHSQGTTLLEVEIRAQRNQIAAAIDRALAAGVVSGACNSCGKFLHPRYRHRSCDACHRSTSMQSYL